MHRAWTQDCASIRFFSSVRLQGVGVTFPVSYDSMLCSKREFSISLGAATSAFFTNERFFDKLQKKAGFVIVYVEDYLHDFTFRIKGKDLRVVDAYAFLCRSTPHIAARAKSLTYTLVTNNEREFSRVHGLVVENRVWTFVLRLSVGFAQCPCLNTNNGDNIVCRCTTSFAEEILPC